jgi:hypothetical protein
LGQTSLLELNFKLSHKNFPFLSVKNIHDDGYEFRPFLFTSFAVLPQEMLKRKESLKENLRASAGFGAQFLLNGYSMEVYLGVQKKKSYEFGSDISFNFGLD